jgi:hypothetical protein
LKPVKVILRRGRGKREKNKGDEPNWGTLYAYVEMSQETPLYDYCKLIKTFKKFFNKKSSLFQVWNKNLWGNWKAGSSSP